MVTKQDGRYTQNLNKDGCYTQNINQKKMLQVVDIIK